MSTSWLIDFQWHQQQLNLEIVNLNLNLNFKFVILWIDALEPNNRANFSSSNHASQDSRELLLVWGSLELVDGSIEVVIV